MNDQRLASSCPRQVWAKVVSEAKKANDVKQLVELGNTQLAALDALLAFLTEKSTETSLPNEVPLKLLGDCATNLHHLPHDLRGLEGEEGRDIGQKILEKLKDLRAFLVPRFAGDVQALTSWLDNLWEGQIDVKDLRVATLDPAEELSPHVHVMSAMARIWILFYVALWLSVYCKVSELGEIWLFGFRPHCHTP